MKKYRLEVKNKKHSKLTIFDKILIDMFIMGILTEEERAKIYNKFARVKKDKIKIFFLIEGE